MVQSRSNKYKRSEWSRRNERSLRSEIREKRNERKIRIAKVVGQGSYVLEGLDGEAIPRAWHVENLRRFYA